MESRRESLIQQLRSSNNQEENQSIISSLEIIYEREIRVNKICEKGLVAALKILAEVEAEMSSVSFLKRLKSTSLSKIPIVGKKFGGSESLMILLKLLYSHLKDQIIYIEENLHKIQWSIKKQYKWTLVLSKRIERGDVVGNISEAKYFKHIEWFHQAELAIINEIIEKSKARKGDIYKILNQINVKLSQNKLLAGIQVGLVAALTPTMTGAAASFFLGPEVFPIFFGIGWVASYSPSIAIVGVLGIKYFTKKSRQWNLQN